MDLNDVLRDEETEEFQLSVKPSKDHSGDWNSFVITDSRVLRIGESSYTSIPLTSIDHFKFIQSPEKRKYEGLSISNLIVGTLITVIGLTVIGLGVPIGVPVTIGGAVVLGIAGYLYSITSRYNEILTVGTAQTQFCVSSATAGKIKTACDLLAESTTR